MADLIKFLRGIKSKLTRDLNLGEPCYITDEERLYIGGSNGNVSLPNNKDIENVNLESTGYGVIGNGLEVTAQSTPNMTVAVSSSPVHMPNGKRFTPPSNTALAIIAADSNKPRKDIVYVNSSGVISCLSSNLGTAAVKGSRSYTLSTNAAGAIPGSNTYTLDKNFVAGDTVVFDGVTFTATSSTQNTTNFVVGADIATSMANLATALNANTTVNAIYTVNASNGIITITEKIAGGGNTPSTMTVTGTGVITVGTAISSKPNDTVTINSIIFTAVLSGANGNQFNIGADTTETAANLVNALNANSNINALYTATSSLNVIILTEKVAGGGNTPTSSSTTGTITITNVLVATSTAQIYPPAPPTPDEGFLLAEIAIGAGATNIVQSNITDKRIFKLNNNQLGAEMADIAIIDNNDFLTFLANNDSIVLPKGTFNISRTLTSNDLTNKKIKGYGKGQTVLKFHGNIDCFDFTDFGVQSRFEMDDLTIEIDTTNTSTVIKLIATTAYIKKIKMNNIEIRCPNYAVGTYYGIKAVAQRNNGIYKNEFNNFEIYYPNYGVYLRSEKTDGYSGNGWIDLNVFENLYIEGFGVYGVDIDDQSADVQTSDNDFVNIRLLNFHNPSLNKTAIKVAGLYNNFINPAVFNDGVGDTFYALEFIAPYGKYNAGMFNTIKNGHFEGKIINPQYINNNFINTMSLANDQPNYILNSQPIGFNYANLYVDSNAGDDSNSGISSSAPCRTIMHAINSLPKNIGTNSITINIADGNYNETVNLNNFIGSGSITINGASSNTLVNNIVATNCQAIININSIQLTATTIPKITATNCQQFYVNNCVLTTSSANSGISLYLTTSIITSCTISNQAYAILAGTFSNILSHSNVGTSNAIVLWASGLSRIAQWETQPSGTTATFAQLGATIA